MLLLAGTGHSKVSLGSAGCQSSRGNGSEEVLFTGVPLHVLRQESRARCIRGGVARYVCVKPVPEIIEQGRREALEPSFPMFSHKVTTVDEFLAATASSRE
jgi:hypothetical protein